MNDFKSEVALDPEVPKVVIYYPAEGGDKLITLMWQHGEGSFTYQIGDEAPKWLEVPDYQNMYLTTAAMINWLDKWCEKYESDEESEINIPPDGARGYMS